MRIGTRLRVRTSRLRAFGVVRDCDSLESALSPLVRGGLGCYMLLQNYAEMLRRKPATVCSPAYQPHGGRGHVRAAAYVR
jgi:hypothetical protein